MSFVWVKCESRGSQVVLMRGLLRDIFHRLFTPVYGIVCGLLKIRVHLISIQQSIVSSFTCS